MNRHPSDPHPPSSLGDKAVLARFWSVGTGIWRNANQSSTHLGQTSASGIIRHHCLVLSVHLFGVICVLVWSIVGFRIHVDGVDR